VLKLKTSGYDDAFRAYQGWIESAEEEDLEQEISGLLGCRWDIAETLGAEIPEDLAILDVRYLGTLRYVGEEMERDSCGPTSEEPWWCHARAIARGEYPLQKLPEHVREPARKLYYEKPSHTDAALDKPRLNPQSHGPRPLIRPKTLGSADGAKNSMILTFPHMGNMYIALRVLLEALGREYVVPPRPSKRTLELGVRHSPETACLPLKINLGDFIEALDRGADTVLVIGGGGPCRFGYYGIIQEQILRNMGYDVTFYYFSQDTKEDFVEMFRHISNGKSLLTIWRAFKFGLRKLSAIEHIEELTRQSRPVCENPREADKLQDKCLQAVDEAGGYFKLRAIERRARREFAALPRRELTGGGLLRVGVVGELYVVLERFVNFDIERKLGRMGVLVTRPVSLSAWLHHKMTVGGTREENTREVAKKFAGEYLAYDAGGESLVTVGQTVRLAGEGYDGIVHLMPFTCMPEIVAQNILTRVSEELKIPVLTLIIDEHTAEAGIMTRLEAFVDLMARKRSLTVPAY
jgi:predicted nucleotide-binding protein (sugar kinase/HSP70/actin superfamily)